jgi:hypothetical protein
MAVYIIEAVGIERAKIGHAAEHLLWHRVQQIAAGCPVETNIMALLYGGVERERILHSEFAKDRVRYEWFTISPTLRAIKSELKIDDYEPSLSSVTGNKSGAVNSEIARVIRDLGGPPKIQKLLAARGHTLDVSTIKKWGHRNSIRQKWATILADLQGNAG